MLVVRKNQQDVLNDLFENLFSNDLSGRLDHHSRFGLPKSNIIESDDSFIIEMRVPGYEKSDFQISLDNQLLNVEVNKEIQKDKNSGKMLFNEFSILNFRRSFRVTKNVNLDEIKAEYENGILKIQIPKMEVENTKRLISIS